MKAFCGALFIVTSAIQPLTSDFQRGGGASFAKTIAHVVAGEVRDREESRGDGMVLLGVGTNGGKRPLWHTIKR